MMIKKNNMKHSRTVLLLIYCFLALVPIQAKETHDVGLHLKITGMKQAEPPHLYNQKLILSYEADHFVRFVGAAFAHEDFKEIHTFVRNDYDVFVLALPVTGERKEVVYRLIVDGLWQPDPRNPLTTADKRGVRLSVYHVPELPSKPITGPEVGAEGRVTFYFKGPEKRAVYITGSFNNWDPFMHRLEEQQEGLYSITLRLTPGEYFYHFISNGRTMLDPFNTRRGADSEGVVVSYFTVPGDGASPDGEVLANGNE
jgi:hypothetical protein